MELIKEIGSTLKLFTDKIVEISNYRYFIESASKRTLQYYEEQLKISQDGKYGEIAGFNTMSSWNIQTGQSEHIGYTSYSFEDLVQTSKIHNNKQYQWLLVDSYEAFEKYMNKIYAYVGYKDKTFWPAKDFGDVSIDELENDLNWFEDCVEKKPKKPNSIYNQFRHKMPIIEFLEKKNPHNIDYKFKIILITQLRHHIVHTRGIIEDIDKFEKNIFNAMGRAIGKEDQEKYKNDIFDHLKKEGSKHCVWLSDHEDKRSFLLENLMAELVAYALLIKDISTMYLSGNPLPRKMATDVQEYKNFLKGSEMYKHLR